LRSRGYRVVRVRHHGDVARLELDPEGIARAASAAERAAISQFFKAQGYSFVAVDLEGYRTGSLNPHTTQES